MLEFPKGAEWRDRLILKKFAMALANCLSTPLTLKKAGEGFRNHQAVSKISIFRIEILSQK
jgi:hypothetical protein